MASRDDDFSILDTTSTNPNPIFNHRHHHQSSGYLFSTHAPPPPLIQPVLISPVDSNEDFSGEDDDGDAEEYSDGGAFCSHPDPKSFHNAIPFSTDNDPIPFENDSKSRINLSNEKRNDCKELSDGGTPYSYKRTKISTSTGGSGECRKDREEWSDAAIASLIDAYTEKFIVQLNRGNLRGGDWEEVAAKLNERCDKQSKSTEQCKNKVDNLKKRYKLERQRMSNSGFSVTRWPWYKKMELIVGNVSEEEKSIGGSASPLKQSKRYGTATSSPSGQITNMNTKTVTNPKWRRVVFKISGAALAGSGSHSIDPKVAMLIAREVSVACSLGVEVAIIVGGRNFFCGDTWVTATGDRCTAYQIGMMATVMNSILLQSALEKMGVQTRVQTAFAMAEVTEPYNRQRAIRHLEKGRVIIFGGIGAGTGNPLFSTDTAAALRASEIHAEAVLKGTMTNNTDGVYEFESKDKNTLSEHVSFREMASRGSSAMDVMALTFCEENNFPVVIFNLLVPGNISRALSGEQVGTLVDQTGADQLTS